MQQAANESRTALKQALAGTDMVFVTVSSSTLATPAAILDYEISEHLVHSDRASGLAQQDNGKRTAKGFLG